MRESSIPWLAVFALGVVHGVNPAMGWLFAVGRGLQERDRRAVWRALGPLAIGHGLAIAAAVAIAMTLGDVLPLGALQWIVAAALFALGADGLMRHRHVGLGGMRVSARQLATWSFLMASAHGAGLMVLPFLLGQIAPTSTLTMSHSHVAPIGPVLTAGLVSVNTSGLVAAVVHTLGYLVVTVVLAVVVYEKVGLGILRRAWINVNVVWSAALVVAAVVTLLN